MVPAFSEGCHAANCREHTPHAWGEVRLIDVQFHLGREVSRMANGAQVMGSVDPCPIHNGEHLPRTHAFIIWLYGRKCRECCDGRHPAAPHAAIR